MNETAVYCSKGCKDSHQGAVVLKEGVGEGKAYLRQDGQGRPPWSRHPRRMRRWLCGWVGGASQERAKVPAWARWIWGSERSIWRNRKCSDGLCEESRNGSRERFIGLFREDSTGTSVMVQWLRCRVPTAGGVGSIPGQGSYVLCGQTFKKLKTKTTGKTPWRTIYILKFVYLFMTVLGLHYCVCFL